MPKVIPVDMSYLDSGVKLLEVDRRIAASPSDIWKVLSDHATWTEWFDGMSACAATSEAVSGVGSTRQVTVGPFELDEEFIAWDENERLAFTITNTNLAMVKRFVEMVELRDVGTKKKPETLVSYIGALEPHMLTFMVSPVLKLRMKSTWKKSFANLEGYLSN